MTAPDAPATPATPNQEKTMNKTYRPDQNAGNESDDWPEEESDKGKHPVPKPKPKR
jgi:hypothetical protein